MTQKRNIQHYFILGTIGLFLFVPNMVFGFDFISGLYRDTETSTDNEFRASYFDIEVTNQTIEERIGPQAESDFEHRSSVYEATGSLEAQYTVKTEIATSTSNTEFCNSLSLIAYRAGTPKHFGALTALETGTSSVIGETWEFQFDLPPGMPVGHGEVCNGDIVFDAWREGYIKEESGYTDEERVSFALTARMVVLNEIYPNPNTDWSYPNNQEWVEIQNTGDTAIDIAGWQVSEMSGDTEKFYDIVGSSSASNEFGTLNGTTLIAPGGYAVVMFEGSKLNNTGDTVRLYEKLPDDSYVRIDEHTYGDYSSSKGKSEARIGSGIGDWVDPFPTPGLPNSLEEILVFEVVTADTSTSDTTTQDGATTSTSTTEHTTADTSSSTNKETQTDSTTQTSSSGTGYTDTEDTATTSDTASTTDETDTASTTDYTTSTTTTTTTEEDTTNEGATTTDETIIEAPKDDTTTTEETEPVKEEEPPVTSEPQPAKEEEPPVTTESQPAKDEETTEEQTTTQ
jgi:hypothetical protein